LARRFTVMTPIVEALKGKNAVIALSIAREEGQSIVLMAVGMVAIVAMLLFVLNASITLLSYRDLNRAATNAAAAGLRGEEAGWAPVEPGRAEDAAQDVLEVELGNVRFMQEDPADVIAGLNVLVHNPAMGSGPVVVDGNVYEGPVVEVTLNAHLCPPAWSCIPVEAHGMMSIETTNDEAATATPGPTLEVTVVPTPTP
jgi:hypothetical protein